MLGPIPVSSWFSVSLCLSGLASFPPWLSACISARVLPIGHLSLHLLCIYSTLPPPRCPPQQLLAGLPVSRLSNGSTLQLTDSDGWTGVGFSKWIPTSERADGDTEPIFTQSFSVSVSLTLSLSLALCFSLLHSILNPTVSTIPGADLAEISQPWNQSRFLPNIFLPYSEPHPKYKWWSRMNFSVEIETFQIGAFSPTLPIAAL